VRPGFLAVRTSLSRACLFLALVPSLASAETQTPTYKPSAARVEGGPILFAGAYDLWGVGGNVSVHYALGEKRLVFVGGRIAFLGGAESGYGGYGGIADAEIGLRPRIVEGRAGAFAFVLAGGVGGAFIASNYLSSPVGFFHLAARVGPSFDIGAFALDVLAGPAMLANGAAAGAFECVVDLGVRF
jgi:hypothetical protein